MRTALLAVLLLLSSAAARATCIPTTGPITLSKIRLGDPSGTWVGCVNTTIDLLANGFISTAAAVSTSTALGGDLTGTVPNAHIGPGVVHSTNVASGAIGAAALAAHAVSTNTVDGVEQVTQGGTGATTSSGARSNLSAAQSGANNDIMSESGGGAAVNFPNGVSGTSATWSNGVTASSGTFTATGAAQYSISTSSGITLGGGGIKFPDGTIQYSKAGSGSGDVVASGNNAFSGSNTHAGSETTLSGGSVVLNSGAAFTANAGSTVTIAGGVLIVPVLSVDGATQSDGCLVVVTDNGTKLIETSTTTSQAVGAAGVIRGSCVPNTTCNVQMGGRTTITETGAAIAGDSVITTTTRCQGSQTGAYASNLSLARILQATAGANTPIWLH